MFITGLFVGFVIGSLAVMILYPHDAPHAEKQDDAGETVDEWGKPDWVGKEVRK